jgi:cobalt-zinc-cadmium efflux system protein
MSTVGRLGLALLLDLLLVAVLLIVGIMAHSLSVLAAGVDYLADGAAIALSLFAIRLARRTERERSNRYPSPTHLAALVNAGWLLILNVGIVVAAAQRLASGAAGVRGAPVLIVGAVAAVVMLIATVIVGADVDDGNGREDLNLKAVRLDIAADAAAAAGVAISGAVILVTGGWDWLDPAVALTIAAVVGYHAVNLIARVLITLRTPSTATGKAAGT